MARLIDISVPVYPGMLIWPSDPPVAIERAADMAKGAHVNLTRFSFGVHTGSHLDAPLHFEADGASIDRLPLDVFMGPARVVRVTGDCVGLEDVDGLAGVQRVLFRTKNSDWWAAGDTSFHPDFAYLTAEAATRLADLGVRLVGLDYLSIDKPKGGGAAHHALLGRGVAALETINLAGVEPGDYELICLPLRLVGAEGSPVRAILRQDQP